MAPSSRHRRPLRGAAAQSVAQRRARENSRGSANSSGESTRSSSATPSEANSGFPAPGSIPPAQGPVPPPAPAPVPTDDLFRQFMQAYMEDRRHLAPAPAPVESREDALDRPLKARNPDLYYGNSHMECYYFCQQCEDHFETAGAKGHKRVPFAATFLKDRILNRWQQYKTRTERNRVAPLSWEEFKAFLRKSLGESDAFVGHVWSKMRGDSQHQQEEVQDWAAHLEHLQSILVEFDADCAPLEGQLGRTFYDGLRPSIKLWIDEVGRQQLSWDELVTAANRAEAKAHIHNNHHLDQRCPRGKRPLKLVFKESREQQSTEKPQPKATTSWLTVTSAKSAGGSQQGSEAAEKARKEKKKNWHRKQRERREASANPEGTPATGPNTTGGKKKAGQNRGQTRVQIQDLSQVTCWNCNKKGHYATNCTEPPKPKN